MAKFRKKPMVIDAIQIRDLLHAGRDGAWMSLPDWVISAYEGGKVFFASDHLRIYTLEGVMYGKEQDWLIRGVTGELYSCQNAIFLATYEPVEHTS